MCDEAEAHAILIRHGLAEVLPLVLTTISTFAPLPGKKRRKSFVLEVIKSLVKGTEKVNLWLTIARNDDKTLLLKYLEGLASYLAKEVDDKSGVSITE